MLNIRRKIFHCQCNLFRVSKRLFSATSVKRSNPFLVTIMGTRTAWDIISLLSNPVGTILFSFLAMAISLFDMTQPTVIINAGIGDPESVEIFRDAYIIFVNYELYLINFILNNIDLLNPESLRNVYLILQEVINVQEINYYLLERWIDSLGEELPERDILIDLSQDFRNAGHNLMGILRNVEDRLNIPHDERMIISNHFEV